MPIVERTLLDRPLLDPSRLPEAARRGWPGLEAVLNGDAEAVLAAARRGRAAFAAADYDRDGLATLLTAGQERLGADPAAIAAARSLAQPGSTVVVTGQQAGLGGGPLYSIFKAASAIVLARQLAGDGGAPVVPVFWLASEDHDLSEIAHLRLPEQEFRADLPAGVAAEAMPVAPAREALEQCLRTVPDDARRDELAALLPASAPDYGTFAAGFLARLFAGTGLVILEPRWLRPGNVDFCRAVLARRSELRAALDAAGKVFRDAGQEPPFGPADTGTGLFWIDRNGGRGQILEETPGRFRVADELLSEAALTERLVAVPAQVSTGAWLRPILQSARLPNAAFIGGPGELRYHLQLPELYDLLGVARPPLLLRHHATLMTPKEQRLAAQLGLTPGSHFAGPEPWRNALELPAELAEPLRRARRQCQEAVQGLGTGELGELLGRKSIGAAASKVADELGKLEARATREFRRAREVDNARVDRLFAVLLPKGAPQERVLSVLAFLDREPGLIAELLAAFAPGEGRHHLLRLG